MIFIRGVNHLFNKSDEFRKIGRDAGFLDDDDYSAGIVYVKNWVGFAVDEELPDQAIESGLSEALSTQLGLENPIFAHELDAEHDDYDNKREELIAYVEGTHPDLPDAEDAREGEEDDPGRSDPEPLD